jgi:hypothetical protein
MDRDERLRLRARLRAVDLSLTVFARHVNIRRGKVYDFFAGDADLTPAELERVLGVLAQHEAFQQVVGVGVVA